MAALLVTLNSINDNGKSTPKFDTPVVLVLGKDGDSLSARIFEDHSLRRLLIEFTIDKKSECARFGKLGYSIVRDNTTYIINFENESCSKQFHGAVMEFREGECSVFSDRTDDSSASQYFQFYGYLSQQQNMLQDFIRTSTYQKAIIGNFSDFQGKVVLDVGAGSGILSFFAAQAGASRVYAVEASSMANHARALVASNGLEQVITVLSGKIEELTLPEKVDVIVSEPMGYMLINERMLETYLHAKKFLKPGGKMFPCQGDLHIAPFQDDALYTEQFNKASFWYQRSFHNVDLRCLKKAAQAEYFGQPIVDTFDIRICNARSVKHTFDFLTADESDLHMIDIPLEYHMLEGGSIHGLAFWFDVLFSGSNKNIWLSTHPTEPLTHWYQVRCLFEVPFFVYAGDVITGFVSLQANKRQSYDVTIQLEKPGTNLITRNTLDLKNPNFRYSGTATCTPPGGNLTSPSDNWWTNMEESGMANGISVINGDGAHLDYQPAIHPGSISSTGRQRMSPITPSSTQQAQLIGGGISPALFTTSSGTSRQQMSHYPVSNSLMIGDYAAAAASGNHDRP